MKKYWTTRDGDEIEYKKLSDNHLLNILCMIEKKSIDGITIETGGGSWDMDDIWYDTEELEGKEVLKIFDYKGLCAEAKSRKGSVRLYKPIK